MRFFADTFFAKRYGNRAIVLETVAAVPGMVGATINHLKALRRMCDDKGWICYFLLDEAANERMHLMTFVEIAKPSMIERLVILGLQWIFYLAFFGLYLVSARTAHRVVGYFEEEAVLSYTLYLKESLKRAAPPMFRRRTSPSAIGACRMTRRFAMRSALQTRRTTAIFFFFICAWRRGCGSAWLAA